MILVSSCTTTIVIRSSELQEPALGNSSESFLFPFILRLEFLKTADPKWSAGSVPFLNFELRFSLTFSFQPLLVSEIDTFNNAFSVSSTDV